MSNFTKLMQEAAAGAAGGAALNVEDVFSTYLYDGTGSNQTITNGIDLSGEGGMVWFKVRTTTGSHALFDTERGTTKYVSSNSNDPEGTQAGGLTAFNTDGFTVGSWGEVNESGQDLASWTFRKAPKFFDVVTYTGDGTTGRQISHNLDHTVGCMIIKKRSASGYWGVYHRSTDSTAPEDYVLLLNSTSAKIDEQFFINDTAPTSTHFTVGAAAASGGDFNTNGATYVAYLWAHNDGDGEFGPDSDADIIKCGSYTGNGSTDGPEIDLGFEPQWLLVKNASASANWTLLDVMRGFPVSGSNQNTLLADSTAAELVNTSYQIQPLSDGFQPVSTNGLVNASGNTYIYIAIRRGPMAVPENATDVFAIDTQGSTGDGNEPSYRTTFPVDMVIQKPTDGGNGIAADRLRGTKRLIPNATDAEANYTSGYWDYMNGWRNTTSTYAPNHAFMWKRAPNYFDAVAYTGNSAAGRTVSHNLGVAPEMMWVKARNFSSGHWIVYHKGANGGTNPEQYYALLNDTSGFFDGTTQAWNDTAPTSSVFTLGTGSSVNSSSYNYIAYLFATVAGVSKVGSYSGTGTSLNIDCGFSSGARYVLIKRTDSTGSWWVFDTERGLVAGADAAINLDTTSAEFSTVDYIDPYSAGFNLTGIGGDINASGGSYIFYAIA